MTTFLRLDPALLRQSVTDHGGQNELAREHSRAFGFPLPQRTISRWTLGQAEPSVDRLLRAVALLGVPLESLLVSEEIPSPDSPSDSRPRADPSE